MTADTFTLITSRAEFHAAIRAAFAHAADVGARAISLVDPTFADWPLNERAVIETLTRWVNSQRKLTLMAHSYDELARRQLRFCEWRRQWSHVVQCRSDNELEVEQIPTLLLVADHACLRLLDRVHYRGSVSARPVDQVECREAIDALLQRSVEAFPVTTLGL
ncbi:MAG: hypothetical protein ABJA61_03360 [Caldimonas sp.]